MPNLPAYLAASEPNPAANRAPWYKNTAPAYAGIFLWVAFYSEMSLTTLSRASVGVCLLALLVAGLLCFALYYYVPGMLGMQTGRPLYIVGASTFGATGGYLMPGLLMGALQIGWFSVATFVSTDFILKGMDSQHWLAGEPHSLFIAIAIVWGYGMAWVAIKGIKYIARLAQFLNWVPLVMLLIAAFAMRSGIAAYHPQQSHPWLAFAAMLQIVIGFFATAGAAGADFGLNNRNPSDIRRGGLIGIALPILVAGGLSVLIIAGAIGRGLTTSFEFSSAIAQVGALAGIMFFLFAVASLVSTCFCAFIASNSFATMLPSIPRWLSTMVGVSVGVWLAASGAANHLVIFFSIVGASFAPICGAMAADYLLAGRKWSGPRAGINWAGYLAWAAGFLTGIIGLGALPVPAAWVHYDQPAALYSFFAGFIVYWALAKAGMRPAVIELPLSTSSAIRSHAGHP